MSGENPSSGSSGTNSPSVGLPSGVPSLASLTAWGDALAPTIMGSSEFQSLSHGTSYRTDPYRSFGYTGGEGISPTERIVFFSADNLSYIEAEVYVPSGVIQSMQWENSSTSTVTYNDESYNYAGYSAQYDSGGSALPVGRVYGNVSVPSSITSPNGANKACCQFAQWIGVANGTGGTALVQGGIAWSGFSQPALQDHNSNNFSLFVEYVPGGSASPGPVTFLSPPSWMNGVMDQNIMLDLYPNGNCGPTGAGDAWFMYWQEGSDYTYQVVHCAKYQSETYGWYVFESPATSSAGSCYDGGYKYGSYYLCQIPKVPTGLSYTGNICDEESGGTCRGINTNSDPVQGYYMEHTTKDMSTSSITGGNSWDENYIAST